MIYAVSDVHGHRLELLSALGAAGLVDDRGDWSGGDSTLWFLGDFLDRGPDGVGTVEVAMQLQAQAEQVGGRVRALLGNHEILAVGLRKFGTQELGPPERRRSFALDWMRNGGIGADQERLTDKHVEWLVDLPALACAGDYLLMHSDTDDYLAWGGSIDEINVAITSALHTDDLERWWECWRRLTKRRHFASPHGGSAAARVLAKLGGRHIVHGHTLIGDLTDTPSCEIEAPLLYADGKVLAIDGGLYDGGPCLVVELPAGNQAPQA